MSEVIARTGRVQSWIDDPTSRLPVSCTVFVVQNEMEGSDGIEASWRFVSHALRYGAGCAVHLSKLDPKGYVRPSGVTASGPVSFGKIYSTLNEILRRGGIYKNGAVVLHLDMCHPDALEFIQTPRHELPWVKRCINITNDWWEACTFKEELLLAIKSGDVWLNKVKYNNEGKRIRGNVCLEVYLPSRGTCLLQHINLGACDVDGIPKAFADGMSELCGLHATTGVGESGEYLPPEVDRQVGLGMLGLANLLRRYGVTYESFGSALDRVNADITEYSPADEIARNLRKELNELRESLSHTTWCVRLLSLLLLPVVIGPPILMALHLRPKLRPRFLEQLTEIPVPLAYKHMNMERLKSPLEVGWYAYKRVADGIMTMLERTGLLHGYSFNSWSDMVTYDEDFIAEWLRSPQTSLYYSLQVMGDVQDKSDAYAALSESEVDDYLSHLLEAPEPQCDCQE